MMAPLCPSSTADDVLDGACPACGRTPTTVDWLDDEFQYGPGEQAVTVLARIPRHTCGGCGLQFTDHVAETLREEAVQRALRQPRHP